MGLGQFFKRHWRFVTSLALGGLTALGTQLAGFGAPLLAGGDVFYLAFLILCAVMVAHQPRDYLKRRGKNEDEGITIVMLIILATMAFFTDAVFTALNRKHGIDVPALGLAGIGAPLG